MPGPGWATGGPSGRARILHRSLRSDCPERYPERGRPHRRGPKDMPARALAEILLEHGLPAREQGRDRTGGADDDHVEQPVIAADPATRLDHRQHLAEVGDEDL